MKGKRSNNSDNNPIRKRFGNILRKIRKVRGKSIYELADDASVDAGYISRLENAHRNPPSPKVLQRFAEALTIPVNLLYMAAGYLEMDSSGKPIDDEEIIRRVEIELTGGKPSADIVPPDRESYSKNDMESLLEQIENIQKKFAEAISKGPSIELPILGKIPAGFPSGMEEYAIGKLKVEKSELPNDPNIFALKVTGESMINAGIIEGDYVVISPLLKNVFDQGSICAVRIDSDEVTLKKVFLNTQGVTLKSANPEYPDIDLPNVSIIGKVVRLIRQF
jgi:SOS-response transcriptional repressor LexA